MDSTNIADAFRKTLDSHGYGFQYAILKLAEGLCGPPKTSPWFPLLPELPVAVQGHDTRVDLVFQHLSYPRLLVAECKRANPATANWCFARAPWDHPPFVSGRAYLEAVHRTSEGRALTTLQYLNPTNNIWHVAREVRAGKAGDSGGSGRGEIEVASGQMLKGLNGLIDLLASREDLLPPGHSFEFVPVIFTTARIYTTTADLGRASLETGKLAADEFEVEQKDWVWYDYPQSPGIKHSVQFHGTSEDLRNLVFDSYVRRIAVVSAAGIEAFLTADLWTAPSFSS